MHRPPAHLRLDRAAAEPVRTGWIVGDHDEPLAGQMRKSAFVAALREEVHRAANRGLAPVGRTSDGCWYIGRLLRRVGDATPAEIDAMASQYLGGGATSAAAYLPAVARRIEAGVAHWVRTGRIPDDAPSDHEIRGRDSVRGDAAPLALAADGPGGILPPAFDPASIPGELGPGEALPSAQRRTLEQGFGQDLGHVRIHRSGRAAAFSAAAGAHAVAIGDHIAFGANRWQPDTPFGQALLAHELAHTLQQRGSAGLGAEATAPAREREADDAARAALTRAHVGGPAPTLRPGQGLRLSRCSRDDPGSSSSSSSSSPAQTPQAAPPAPAPAPPAPDPVRVALESVTSDQMAAHQQRASTNLTNAQTRLRRRNQQLEDLERLTSDTTRLETIARMRTRWVGTLLADANADPAATVSAETSADLLQRLRDDKADAALLANAGLTDWVEKLGTSLTSFLTKRRELQEEQVEFHRFDDDFMAADVQTALNTVPGFGPAHLKAMLGQETGDFTNTAVAGITGKTQGITTSRVNPNYTGVGQMNAAAQTDAIRRGNDLGIATGNLGGPDALEDPPRSILLAALYVSWLGNLLQQRLPAPQPTGDDFVRFLLASYNGGPANTVDAITTHRGTGTGAYTWADVAGDDAAMREYVIPNNPNKATEVRNYVSEIMARIP